MRPTPSVGRQLELQLIISGDNTGDPISPLVCLHLLFVCCNSHHCCFSILSPGIWQLWTHHETCLVFASYGRASHLYQVKESLLCLSKGRQASVQTWYVQLIRRQMHLSIFVSHIIHIRSCLLRRELFS